MGYKALVFILIISLLFMGCSAVNYSNQPNYSERDYRVFNRYGLKYNSHIYFLDGKVIATNYVNATDSLVFFEYNSDTLSMQQSKIEKIEMEATGNKIANGLLWGISGLATSITLLTLLLPNCNDPGCSILVIPIIVVGIVSAVIGYIKGNKEYVFNDKSNHEKIEYYKKYHKRKDSLNSNVNSNINNIP